MQHQHQHQHQHPYTCPNCKNNFGMGITVFPEQGAPAPKYPSLDDVPEINKKYIQKYDMNRCSWRLSQLSQPNLTKSRRKFEPEEQRRPRKAMKVEYEMLEHLSRSEPLWMRSHKTCDDKKEETGTVCSDAGTDSSELDWKIQNLLK